MNNNKVMYVPDEKKRLFFYKKTTLDDGCALAVSQTFKFRNKTVR